MKGKIETVKTVVLWALVFCMLGLIRITWVYGLDYENVPENVMFHGLFALAPEEPENLPTASISAYPVQFAVGKDGELTALQQDAAALQSAFGTVSPVLREAFSNLGQWQEVQDIKPYLQQPLLYLHYDGALPLPLLAAWLEAPCQSTLSVGTMLLVQESEQQYAVLVRNGSDGRLYKGSTAVDERLFSDTLHQFSLSSCQFAADLAYESLVPETLVFTEHAPYQTARPVSVDFSQVGGQESKQSVLEAFEYNPYTAKSYYDEGESAWVYVENDSTLSITDNGRITFEASVESGGLAAYPKQDLVSRQQELLYKTNLCHTILQSAYESVGGGETYLSRVTAGEKDGMETICFDGALQSVPVSLETGYLAKFVFQDNLLVSSVIYLSKYEMTGETVFVMPMEQVAASIRGGDTGVCVRYEQADGVLAPKVKRIDR